jgi:hypothetical protein
MNQLVLRNPEHRKLSADERVGSAHGKPRAGEDLKVLLPGQLPQAEHTRGHRPSGVKADTVDHRPTGRRVRSPLALSRNSHGIRPTYENLSNSLFRQCRLAHRPTAIPAASVHRAACRHGTSTATRLAAAGVRAARRLFEQGTPPCRALTGVTAP